LTAISLVPIITGRCSALMFRGTKYQTTTIAHNSCGHRTGLPPSMTE